tara:strand:+ start:4342 stop:4542 length:201 start_codon:yes stop_codon:yes gene_type:complete
MKILIPLFMILAFSGSIFNLTQVNWTEPLVGKSSVAVIGVMASASAFLLLLILSLSIRVSKKLKEH